MDSVFRKTTSVFNAVKVARVEPRRYGKNGELLISYEDTEEHAVRTRSVTSATKMGQDFHIDHSLAGKDEL